MLKERLRGLEKSEIARQIEVVAFRTGKRQG